MKEIEKMIDDEEIIYLVGTNSKDNFDVIDRASENDIWFHAKQIPSCHVVALLPPDINIHGNKKLKQKIIVQGCVLCKQHTNSIKDLSNVEMVITNVSNLIKHNKIMGQVSFHDNSLLKYRNT